VPAWSQLEGACGAPRLNVALARLVDLKAALLAEARACGLTGLRGSGDGPRIRVPQLARCSRDQLRRWMGQHGAALGRGRGGGCEVFRAPPILGLQDTRPITNTTRVGRLQDTLSTLPIVAACAELQDTRCLK
jgi:hypothetical protein